MKKRTRKKILKYLFRLFILFGGLGLGSIGGMLALFYWYSMDIPSIGPLLAGYSPPQVTRIFAMDGTTVLGELFFERRTVVPLSEIPEVMIDAVIACEDADFRKHKGLDYPGMLRAIYMNIVSGRLSQGASTITQQVARTFFLSRRKKFSRKIKEILLTLKIEENLTKDEILFLYLNQINFGHARYGVYEAARFYFKKDVSELTLDEATLLAGIPKAPSFYSPGKNPSAAKKRRTYVLGEMEKLNMITSQQKKNAENMPLKIFPGFDFDRSLAPEAVSMVIKELINTIDMQSLKHDGYKIITSLDARLQHAARKAVQNGLHKIDVRHGHTAPFTDKRYSRRKIKISSIQEGKIYFAKVDRIDNEDNNIILKISDKRGVLKINESLRYNLKELGALDFTKKGMVLRVSLRETPVDDKPLSLKLEEGPQAALACINPADFSIKAIVGGYNVRPGGFVRATMARRQPGSAFKPFVYLTAILERKYTAASLIDDSPEIIGDWKPENSSAGKYKGAVRLRDALAHSMNLPAIKLIRDLNPQTVKNLAVNLGINEDLEAVPSLALGSSPVTPLEMAGAYGVMAAGGNKRKPWLVTKILDSENTPVPFARQNLTRVLSKPDAYLITSLLKSVIEEGTGKRAKKLGRPAAGKTGTTDKSKDAWFVGFTTQLVTSVWVGYDDNISIGRREYGAKAALPIWLQFMQDAHKNLPVDDFKMPEGIISLKIDPESGLLAWEEMENPIEEIFIEGTQPVKTAIPPDLVSPDSFLMDQYGGGPNPDGRLDN